MGLLGWRKAPEDSIRSDEDPEGKGRYAIRYPNPDVDPEAQGGKPWNRSDETVEHDDPDVPYNN